LVLALLDCRHHSIHIAFPQQVKISDATSTDLHYCFFSISEATIQIKFHAEMSTAFANITTIPPSSYIVTQTTSNVFEYPTMALFHNSLVTSAPMGMVCISVNYNYDFVTIIEFKD
jgi:hypothetical protein